MGFNVPVDGGESLSLEAPIELGDELNQSSMMSVPG